MKKRIMVDMDDVITTGGFLHLINTFPFINPNNIIFLGNKSVLNCDIKIDDRIDNLDGAKTKILFTAWHNKNISKDELNNKKIKRANNWKEIENIFLKEGININE